NQTGASKQVSWFEYWDVNPYDQANKLSRGVEQAAWDPSTATLSVGQNGGLPADSAPLTIFAASLQGPLDGYETSLQAFFGGGTRAAPAEVIADHLTDSLAGASPAGTPGGKALLLPPPPSPGPRPSA